MTSYVSCESTSVPFNFKLDEYEIPAEYVHFSNICKAKPRPLDIFQVFIPDKNKQETYVDNLIIGLSSDIYKCIFENLIIETDQNNNNTVDFDDFKGCITNSRNINATVNVTIDHEFGSITAESDSPDISIEVSKFYYENDDTCNFLIKITFIKIKRGIHKNGDKYFIDTSYSLENRIPLVVGSFERVTKLTPKTNSK
jgi:hypothetical protein